MRKRVLLFTLALFSLTVANAQNQQENVASMEPVEATLGNLNPVNPQIVLDNFAKRQPLTAMPKREAGFKGFAAPMQAPRRAATDTVQYLVAAQSHLKNYQFNINGGDFTTWNAGVCVDGTKVTITDGTMRGWKEIRVADGKEGWVETDEIEII